MLNNRLAVNKSVGLQHIAAELGLQAGDFCAFGDEFNDWEMFAWAVSHDCTYIVPTHSSCDLCRPLSTTLNAMRRNHGRYLLSLSLLCLCHVIRGMPLHRPTLSQRRSGVRPRSQPLATTTTSSQQRCHRQQYDTDRRQICNGGRM